MRAVIQKVSQASVKVENKIVGQIDHGFVVLLGVTHNDTEEDAEYLAKKICHLRIFEDEAEKMNLSLLDVQGSVLSISQFTLYSDTRKGRRPSFTDAARPEQANQLYEYFNQQIESYGVKLETGEFGAMMDVSLINQGPVTIIIDSEQR
ncbi:D-aminoacyl-tRNA deacylase [Amphibacillus xylanus]|uniref:D-aminoacyl-tRNA deacylase n=1 Tax=Amphibacillus xylanus (strain ATCC 51415 / DSM 6626 / JCM 7361 / LMG 17667 / NBRC 15112 / Ep01) TaxID=698758 RepID=K0J238_AMPXN|nr:D-aminoacyl-tRNA deacylase [Amphibacillus xylanus]BAM47182.1 D-tyrosyl-tRNA(Tyr) deacylase [Amphibacillus xylanus NBRC 15112]